MRRYIGSKVIIEDGRCVAVHDEMADLLWVDDGMSRFEIHVESVQNIDTKDAFKPDDNHYEPR